MRLLPKRRSFLWIAAPLCAVILYGFGGQHGAEPGPQQHVIEIRDFQYHQVLNSSPQPGDTVTWVNRDLVPHTATATDRSWSTAELKQGERGSIVITKGMQAAYFCRYHPAMRGRMRLRGSEQGGAAGSG